MKRMTWKWLGCVLLIILACSLAACKGKEKEETLPPSDTGLEETDDSQTDKDTPDADIPDQSGDDAEAGNTAEEDIIGTAERYIDCIVQGEYDKLNTDFAYIEQMKTETENGNLKASFEALMQQLGAFEEKKESFIVSQSGLQIVNVPCLFENLSVNFNVAFNEAGEISGVTTAEFSEKKAAELPAGVSEEELELTIDGGKTLPGTLASPQAEGKYPAVVFVHGSGPNDRNETLSQNTPFQDIAWGLAEQNIVSYRYDKRTFVYNLAGEKDLTIYDETIDDAAAAVALVKTLPNVDPDRVFVIGHSLGATVMPLIAEKSDCAGYVMMAPLAREFMQTMVDQYEFLAELDGTVTDEEQAGIDAAKAAVEKLKNPETVNPEEVLMGAYASYWIDLNSYDLFAEAEKIQKPVLLLQGEEDYQVTLEDDFNVWKEKLSGKENWTFVSYPGLTHLFAAGEKKLGPSSCYNANSVDTKVISDIATFILNK